MMNGRHLPAGQGMHHDMNNNRRRSYNPPQYQPTTPMYNGYYNSNYYPQPPPQYQHGAMHPQYAPYPSYGRSPPPQFPQYAPPPIVNSYPRPQLSPAIVTTPYQPPPQNTPSIPSTQSVHTMPGSSTPSTTHVSQSAVTQPDSRPLPSSLPPFQPPVPWLSRPDLQWPVKNKPYRRRPAFWPDPTVPIILPNMQPSSGEQTPSETMASTAPTAPIVHESQLPETPSTTQPPSEEAPSTTPTTPISLQPTAVGPTTLTTSTNKPTQRPAAVVPIIPAVPKPPQRSSPTSHTSARPGIDSQALPEPANSEIMTCQDEKVDDETDEAKPKAQAVNEPPKLWTGLFKGTAPAIALPAAASLPSSAPSSTTGAFTKSNSESLSDALRSFSATVREAKLSFLEPRGLVNTGNMCYMNSVLQVLVFCVPFYDFLDQVGKRAAHSFKSDTPLIDAMIMFMREFSVIDSAATVEQLRMRLKENELEQYGESFTPDFVYDVIRRLPRFSTMRRGHQQDAEEFLGFLLEGLHDECVQVMQSSSQTGTPALASPSNVPSSPVSDVASLAGSTSGEAASAWLEVGPKQRPAITRSSGTILVESPITKIFGGSLRSELRVPGLKNSVTMEPYQPLQLDIGSPNVNNIVDALKGLTRPETLHGDFKSPRGPGVTATKQVLIETLPPVLILHLKRFQYDNTGGTQKIWKKVGYPLELEIPKEVFSRQRQSSILNHGGPPKYLLTAVVYHHGKNASGGHYTVDVRRQEGREWIRLDDTVLRRVRSEDVAEAGSEEDPKVLAAALDAKKDILSSGNIFSQMKMDDDEEIVGEDGWKQVNGPSASANGGGKKWSSVVNGATTPKAKNGKSSIKDNKVAYLLFYQKIGV